MGRPVGTARAHASLGIFAEPGLGCHNTCRVSVFWIQMNLQADQTVFSSIAKIKTVTVKSVVPANFEQIASAFNTIQQNGRESEKSLMHAPKIISFSLFSTNTCTHTSLFFSVIIISTI